MGASGGPNDEDDERDESPAPNDFRARFRQSIAPPLTGIPPPPPAVAAVIDPELGQGRIEAEAVADHLERFERGMQG